MRISILNMSMFRVGLRVLRDGLLEINPKEQVEVEEHLLVPNYPAYLSKWEGITFTTEESISEDPVIDKDPVDTEEKKQDTDLTQDGDTTDPKSEVVDSTEGQGAQDDTKDDGADGKSEATETQTEQVDPESQAYTEEALREMHYTEHQAILAKRGLPTDGNKEEKIQRILSSQ